MRGGCLPCRPATPDRVLTSLLLLQQDLYGFPYCRERKCPRDVRRRAQSCAAIQLQCGIAADLRTHAAYRAIGLRVLHVLQRIDRRYAEVAIAVLGEIELAAQLLADQGEH